MAARRCPGAGLRAGPHHGRPRLEKYRRLIFRDADDQPRKASYALVLVELAIERDMRRLQGPPLIELFGTSHPGT